MALTSQEASAGEPRAANGVKTEEEAKAEDGADGGSQQAAQSRPEGPAAGTRRRPRARIAAEEDSDADAGDPGESLSSAASSSPSDTGAVSPIWDLS